MSRSQRAMDRSIMFVADCMWDLQGKIFKGGKINIAFFSKIWKGGLVFLTRGKKKRYMVSCVTLISQEGDDSHDKWCAFGSYFAYISLHGQN